MSRLLVGGFDRFFALLGLFADVGDLVPGVGLGLRVGRRPVEFVHRLGDDGLHFTPINDGRGKRGDEKEKQANATNGLECLVAAVGTMLGNFLLLGFAAILAHQSGELALAHGVESFSSAYASGRRDCETGRFVAPGHENSPPNDC